MDTWKTFLYVLTKKKLFFGLHISHCHSWSELQQDIVSLVLLLERNLLFTFCYYLLSLKFVCRDIDIGPFSCSALYGYIRLLIQVKGYQRRNLTLVDVFQKNAASHPSRPCIFFEDQEWTFGEVIKKLFVAFSNLATWTSGSKNPIFM